MSRPKVYLAGPITGLTYAGATDWREYAQKLLAPHIAGMSPMRGKDYLAAYGVIGGTPEEAYMKETISSQSGILGRDRNDVKTADAILMNLAGAKQVSIGTMIEAGWADAYRIPIVLVTDDDNIHKHVMLHGLATNIVQDLDQAVYLIRVLLGAPVVRKSVVDVPPAGLPPTGPLGGVMPVPMQPLPGGGL